MHETSLGQVITDYLTGQEIEETTYEEFRQALARMLVEEKGYPRQNLKSKVGIVIPVDGKQYCRVVDLVAFADDGKPLLVMIFCPGDVDSFDREILAMARVIPGGPAKFALATDTKDAVLVEAAGGSHLGQGMRAILSWEELLRQAAETDVQPLEGDRLVREQRILYTYSEFLTGCCGSVCAQPGNTPKE